jgi:hypothetical protein
LEGSARPRRQRRRAFRPAGTRRRSGARQVPRVVSLRRLSRRRQPPVLLPVLPLQ